MVGHAGIIFFFLQESFHDRQGVIERGKTSILGIGGACTCVVARAFLGLAGKGLMVCHTPFTYGRNPQHTQNKHFLFHLRCIL